MAPKRKAVPIRPASPKEVPALELAAENLNPYEFALRPVRAGRRLPRRSTPGRAQLLSQPKRQLIVSVPIKMDNKKIKVFTGYRVQHSIARGTVQGRHPLPSGRHARRGQGARDVDDLEVRRREHSLRRRQGRHHGRPEEALDGRERAPDPPLHVRDRDRPRPRPRHPGARRLHDAAAHGLDHGHVLDDAGLFDARRRHRASRSRSAARPAATRRPPRAASWRSTRPPSACA